MEKTRFVLFALMILAIPLFNSCCTILSGSKEMTFTSEPPGADVFESNGVYIGTTPCTEKIKGCPDYFEFKLAGYPDQRVACPRKFNHLFWLNIPMPCGFIVDVATNRTHTPKFTKYHADMSIISMSSYDNIDNTQPLLVEVNDSIYLEKNSTSFLIDTSK